MISKIDKLTIYVDSQDDARSFWTEKMGFSIVADEPMGPDARWLEVSPQNGSDVTTLVLYSKHIMQDQSPESIAHPSIMFSSADIEGLWNRLHENGVETSDIQDYNSYKMFDFRDNEGNPYMVRG